MPAVSMTGLRGRAIPAINDRGSVVFQGTSVVDYPADGVLITAEAMRRSGGNPFVSGKDFSVLIYFGYLSSAGVWTALFSTEFAAADVLRIYDPITGEQVATRTKETVISGTVLQIDQIGATNALLVSWLATETTHPAPGLYRWSISLSGLYNHRLGGWIEILPEFPTA